MIINYNAGWSVWLALMCILPFAVLPKPTYAAEITLPILVVTIRDQQDAGVTGVTILVRDRSGQREFARAVSNAQGIAMIASLPTLDVRIAIQGRLANGIALTQTGEDALGIAMNLDVPPNQLDLRVEPDGSVVPDPTTMITLDPGIVSVPAPIATAAFAEPTVTANATSIPAAPPIVLSVSATDETRWSFSSWVGIGVALILVGILAVVLTMVGRWRTGGV